MQRTAAGTRLGIPLLVVAEGTNGCSAPGATAVQLYLVDVLASVSLPARMLRGFAKVPVPAGGVRTVDLTLGPRELSLVDQRMRTVVEPGTFEVHVGASSTDTPLSATFEVR